MKSLIKSKNNARKAGDNLKSSLQKYDSNKDLNFVVLQ